MISHAIRQSKGQMPYNFSGDTLVHVRKVEHARSGVVGMSLDDVKSRVLEEVYAHSVGN